MFPQQFLILRKFEARDGWTDGQTNGVQRIHNKCIASPWAYQETVAS